ncbi:hypothetical protein DFS33DRAFT_779106 [Desarmillaria ectypa]|nr:hypothetical protein DFS33DRAFT_779106 [Desarmillaria ectypa]
MQGIRRLVPVNSQLHKQVPNVCHANWKEMYYRAPIGKTERGGLLFNVDPALSNALEPNDVSLSRSSGWDAVPCPPLFIFGCAVTYDLHSLLHDRSAYGLVSTRASTAPSHLSHAVPRTDCILTCIRASHASEDESRIFSRNTTGQRLDYEHQIMMQLRPQLPVVNSFITRFRKMIPKGVTIAVSVSPSVRMSRVNGAEGQYPERFCST